MIRPWSRELLDEVARHLAEKHPGTVWLLEQPQVNDPTAAGSGRFGGDGETVGEGDPERGADSEWAPVG